MLLRFAGRLGQVLIAPRAALRRIEAEGGGFRDALWLVVVGTLCLRFSQFAEALLGLAQPSMATILRVAGVFSNAAREAAMVVIPATIASTVLAGRHRDATLDRVAEHVPDAAERDIEAFVGNGNSVRENQALQCV